MNIFEVRRDWTLNISKHYLREGKSSAKEREKTQIAITSISNGSFRLILKQETALRLGFLRNPPPGSTLMKALRSASCLSLGTCPSLSRKNVFSMNSSPEPTHSAGRAHRPPKNRHPPASNPVMREAMLASDCLADDVVGGFHSTT